MGGSPRCRRCSRAGRRRVTSRPSRARRSASAGRTCDGRARGVPRADSDRSRQRPRTLLGDRKSTRLNSSHLGISYAVFCLKKKRKQKKKSHKKKKKYNKNNNKDEN